jgi:flagellar hook-associated protein 3 FlgL
MRIASSQYSTTMNTVLQEANTRLAALTEKLASGKRLLLPSEDPLTSVRLSRLTREESAVAQYRDNIAAVKTRLTQNEGCLDGMSGDILQARDLMVGALDGANSASNVQAMAGPLAALRDSLFYTANSRDQEGRYTFSGTASATPAMTYDPNAAPGARYTFTGNTEVQNVVVSSGVTQAANVSVPEMAALLNQLDSAVATMQSPGLNVNDPASRAVLTGALNGIDTGLDAVSGKIAGLGGAQNILSTLDTNHANVSLSNQQSLIDLGQLDVGQAAVQLSAYTAAVQATQKAYAKVSSLSLFDAL